MKINLSRSLFIAAALAAVVFVVASITKMSIYRSTGMVGGENSLVVYCAHDAVYAQGIIDKFEKQTGIDVKVRFDSEATKSLGLTEMLASEKDNPRCDVFWNNQLLGTADLNERGVLQVYKGSGYERIPAEHKDAEGYYSGFAARLRVYIVNTQKMDADEAEMSKAILMEDLSQGAIAKPLFGTTLTHYSVLWDYLGEEGLKQWHNRWRERGIIEKGGNSTVKNLLAEGVCSWGLTDTDDYFVGKDAGKAVEMLPVRLDDGKSICIPNTVAIIKGSKRLENAKLFVDYLLSEETEIALANAKSRQIPLGKVDESRISDDVKQLREWASNSVSLVGLTEDRRACLAWLKAEYLHK